VVAVAMLASVALLGAGPLAAGASTGSSDSSCGYYFEWLHVVRFPLQPDPHAAYSYVAISAASAQSDHVAFVVQGPFPYAAWTSWDVYGQQGKPVQVTNGENIVPDAGSTNPFVVGKTVTAVPRNFKLLYLPQGVNQSETASSLQDIPAANVFQTPSPSDAGAWVLANRVYQAFPSYNQGGSGGPTNTPFPSVTAVNYQTGQPVSCSSYNLIPAALQRQPTNPPRAAATAPPPVRIRLTNGEHLPLADSSTSPPPKAEYAPPNPPGRLQFTRPPAAAGADVSAVPPPDRCAGYLGTRTSLTRVSLIRIPHVPTFFNVTGVTSKTTFPTTEAAYVSATEYGSSLGVYQSGSPYTTSLGDGELNLDHSGGATIVVWPRVLSRQQRQRVFAYASQRRWAILRGGTQNAYTTANLLIREKRSSAYQFGTGHLASYYGSDTFPMHTGQPWRRIHGAPYVASPHNLGPTAPQGVTCTMVELADGQCLRRLKSYIRSSGGHYFSSG